MSTDTLEFSVATPAEVELMVEWAAREGWNPGDQDPACFHATDPEGFWMARHEGEFAACMSLVEYGPGFAFLGFYITRPDLRGRGIGYALWQHALGRCRATTIGLDGVVDQQENYRKSGFDLAHRNVRYGGTPTGMTAESGPIAAITTADIPAIEAYDRGLFPAPRAAFMSAWLSTPEHLGLCVRDEAGIRGYGVIRPCREGHKIGPLFADNAETAEILFDALVARSGCQTVFLDPPEPNPGAVDLCRSRGLEPVFETARMYRGTAPELPIGNIFGITTFELG